MRSEAVKCECWELCGRNGASEGVRCEGVSECEV